MSIFLWRVREGMTGREGERCHVCGRQLCGGETWEGASAGEAEKSKDRANQKAADTGRSGSL